MIYATVRKTFDGKRTVFFYGNFEQTSEIVEQVKANKNVLNILAINNFRYTHTEKIKDGEEYLYEKIN